MRKTQKAAVIALAGALTIGGAFAAFAADQGQGQWCNGAEGVNPDTTWKNADGQTVSSWWFAVSPDGTKSLANTWHWIKNADGNMYCYYFDKDGWMVVDGTVSGASVDANGMYVENGAVVSGDESKIYYTASTDFLNIGKTTAESGSENAAAESTTAPAGTDNSGANSGKTVTSGKNVAKATGHGGETPTDVALPFTLAEVNGMGTTYSIVNNWANYSLNLSGYTVEKGDGNSNMDFLATSDDNGTLSVQFYPLDLYTAGNTSLDAFVQSYMNSTKPGAKEVNVKSVRLGEDVSFGGDTYKQVIRSFGKPINKTEDFSCYLRQVEGTNYVMEINTKNSSDSFAAILGTMQKVR